ncbi:MAG TPA: pilus assembly protein PilW [Janthinobacterium sp.]|nr:pilus assembly protein PilW [Janthinobacterium sp.]
MRRRQGGAPRRARGVTMAELTVALALGALVALVGSALLVSASASYLNQAEAARLNDGGLYALQTIGRAVRQSAFGGWDDDAGPLGARPEDGASVSGIDARTLGRDSEGIELPLGGAVNGSDVLALRYVGAGAGADGDGSVLNCAGFGVAKAASDAQRSWSIFYVGSDAGGEAELRCKYRGANGWGADAIVRGVDSFQVLYGLDTDDPADGVANLYVNASAIEGLDGALVPLGANAAERALDRNRKTHWKRVVSVKVALLLHGAPGSAGGALPARFDLFGKAYSDAWGGGDTGVAIDEKILPPAQRGRARRMVDATILLRNPQSER